MLIAFDFDDIIFESFPAIEKFTLNNFGIQLPTPTDFKILDRHLTPEQMDYLFQNVLIDENYLEPNYDCINFIHDYYKKYGYTIYFITHRSLKLVEGTREITERYLPNIPFQIIHTKYKLDEINEKGIDYFIEDRYANARELADAQIPVFLRIRTWNKGRESHPMITPFKEWRTVREKLKI